MRKLVLNESKFNRLVLSCVKQCLKEGLTPKVSNSDIAKMKDYMAKGSNPSILVKSIKDPQKLVNRWMVAKQLGWDSAVKAFKNEIINRGIMTADELQSNGANVETIEGGTQYSEIDKRMLNGYTANAWRALKKVFGDQITFEKLTGPVTIYGKESMRRNGNRWNDGCLFTINGKRDGFDFITNESVNSNSIGYSYDGSGVYGILSLKDLVNAIVRRHSQY